MREQCSSIRFFLLVLLSATLTLVGMGCRPASVMKPHTLPRLCGVFWKVDEYAAATGDPDFLYQFDAFRTRTEPEALLEVLAGGPAEWRDRVQMTYPFLQKAVDVWQDDPSIRPPNWKYKAAINQPPQALTIAVHENYIRGADWRLLTIEQNPVPIYQGGVVTLNWHPLCPKGKWNGEFELHGKTYNLGDTRGLAVSEWLPVMAANVMLGTAFEEAYDGFQIDDDPCYGFTPWQMPDPDALLLDPDCDGENGMRWQLFEEQCREPHETNHAALAALLSRKFLMQVQFVANADTPEHEKVVYYNNFHGAKLSCYGGGAGASYNYPEQYAQWPEIEERYCVLGRDGQVNEYVDRIQGADGTLAESRPRKSWSMTHPGRIERHLRFTLAATLIGGDGWFGAQWFEDEQGLKFISGEHDSYPDIPQMHFELGRAISLAFDTHQPGMPAMPVHARYFECEGVRYTVVCNPWNQIVCGVPKQDAAWFLGLWPYLYDHEIKFAGDGITY